MTSRSSELVDAESVPRYPNALRIRLNFLGDAKPFEKLIGISERAVHDPVLAADLFPKWVEQNESVITNVLPMHWIGTPAHRPQRRSDRTGRRETAVDRR